MVKSFVAVSGVYRLVLAGIVLLIPATIANRLSADTPCGGGGGQPVCPCHNTSKPCILTAAYDNQRDGYNPNESTLTASAISTKSLVVGNTFSVDTNDLPQYLGGVHVNAGTSNARGGRTTVRFRYHCAGKL